MINNNQKYLHTQFGTVYKNNDGYYQIKTKSEGNYLKLWHRLIFEKFYKTKIPKGYIIHHKNGNRNDNCILNLQLMKENEHNRISNLGRKLSEETKLKISQAQLGEKHHFFGKKFSDEHKNKISKSISKTKNKTGYYRVSKQDALDCKQGFRWCYAYNEHGKQKYIKSVDIKKLEEKVKDKGLEWFKF